MTESQFSVVPLEVVLDRRLTLEQTRVLIALFSFRNKVTNTVWPSRAAIAERTGMHPSNISSATTALVNLGWLIKDGVGGHSKATRYTLCVPDFNEGKVAQSATVADQATVAQSATQTVAQQATTPVADQATRKEQSIEQSKEEKKKRVTAPALAKPDDVTDQTWTDWLQLRKGKKAAVTQTVLDAARDEAVKAMLPLESFLQIWCFRGSQGLQADWLKPAELQKYGQQGVQAHKYAGAAAAIFDGVWE